MFLQFDLPPVQDIFDEDNLRNMDVGRRQLRTEWPKTFYPPDSPEKDWLLMLPFPNTYQNAYLGTFQTGAYPHHASTGKFASTSGEPARIRSRQRKHSNGSRSWEGTSR